MYFWGKKKMKVMKKYMLVVRLLCGLVVLGEREKGKWVGWEWVWRRLDGEEVMGKDRVSVGVGGGVGED